MQLSIPSPNSGLDKSDLQLFVEAIGWMELGAFNEALNVLKELSQNAQENNDILKLHWHLRYKLHDYPQCQFIGNLLTQKYPNLVESWVLYAQSYYGESNYEKAFEIFSYLHDNGILESCYYLGYMYEHGDGVEQDIAKALAYYREQCDSQSSLRLGLFYMYGQYVEQDSNQAMHYFLNSHEKESYLYQGILLERQKDYSSAFQAYLKGAKCFQKDCLYKTGLLLKLGLGVELNMEDAIHYLTYGYYLLHEECAYELAMLYFDGVALKKDVKKALQYLHQAARLNSYEACLLLSQFYELGRYVKKHHGYALSYYQQAQMIKEGKEKAYEII